MCGITGIINFNKNEEISHLQLEQMLSMIAHRGPDEFGIYIDDNAGLAHARLSIIDLADGQQPMHNEDKSFWIVFNGEIFNYPELRINLEKNGHIFSTQSDTEVIIHLFEEKGVDCLKYLNGQFSFAIWNRKKRELFIARDRMGVRPLFYTYTNGRFIFGSEIKAIFANRYINREIDIEAIDQIFTFWFPIPPKTAFKGIYELPSGHYLLLRENKLDVIRYWDINFSNPEEDTIINDKKENDYAEEILDLLVDATRIRLRADVPVGAYLSGGLDSTIITAIIRKFSNASLKTFSVTFDDPEFDEGRFQQEAVNFLDTEHRNIQCKTEDIGDIFPEVIWHTEKPILRTAPAPLYLLSKLVRDSGYKVVLTGEGSDEIFGGYDIFKEVKIRDFLNRMPESKMRPLLWKRLYPYLSNIQTQSPLYLNAFFQKGDDSKFSSHMPRWNLTSKSKVFFSEEIKAALNGNGNKTYLRINDFIPKEFIEWNNFLRAQYLEGAFLLPNYILSSQGDRMSMANAVEGRFPFLDYRVVELANRLPVRLKMNVLNEKYILKRGVKGLIPPLIAKRHKQPYRAPESKSFFGRKKSVYVEELLNPDTIKKGGFFNPSAVSILVRKCAKGDAIGIKDNMAFIGILSFQLLHRQFIEEFKFQKNAIERDIKIFDFRKSVIQ